MMFGAAGLCVFALMARRAGASIFQTHVLTKNMLLRAVFEFFGRLFYVLAIALTPMSSATAILQSAPLFVVLGARIFLREKVDAKTWIAIFLGLFGVLIILRPSAADFSLLSLLALIGTLGFVGRDLFSRTAPSSLTKEVLGFYGFTTMMIAGACYAVWDGKPFVSLQAQQFIMLAAALLAGVFALHCPDDSYANRLHWGRYPLQIFTPAIWNIYWRDCFRRATGCTHAFGLRYCDWRWAVYRLAKPASSTRSMMTGSFSGRITRTPCLLKIST